MNIQFQTDNAGFKFRTFGQSADEGYSNVLDWLIEMIGVDEVFKEYLPDLRKLAMPILEKSNKVALEKYPKQALSYHASFVTAWKYHGFQVPETSYGGGYWEEEWELLGLVDLDNISATLANDLYLPIKGVIDKET